MSAWNTSPCRRPRRRCPAARAQRIRLASQIGSGLTGVLYVLDEPSIGLHQRDNARLLETLKRLRDLGNSVIVVEHDEEAIAQRRLSDRHGPRRPVFTAARWSRHRFAPKQVFKQVTRQPDRPVHDRLQADCGTGGPAPGHRGQAITIKRRHRNNLRGVDATIPLGTFTCVTGVSGSGKSTLVIETLYKAMARRLHGARCAFRAPHSRGHRGPRVPRQGHRHRPVADRPHAALQPGDLHRRLHADPRLVRRAAGGRRRGYKPGRFSFNVKGGRCEACQGDGVIKIEMHFLPDVYVQCDVCKGKRYNRETLEIVFKRQVISPTSWT